MSTTTEDRMAEAAGLILAEAKGDETVGLFMQALIDSKDGSDAILMLASVIAAAGLAVRAECQRAAENGDDSTASVDTLTGMQLLLRGGRTDA